MTFNRKKCPHLVGMIYFQELCFTCLIQVSLLPCPYLEFKADQRWIVSIMYDVFYIEEMLWYRAKAATMGKVTVVRQLTQWTRISSFRWVTVKNVISSLPCHWRAEFDGWNLHCQIFSDFFRQITVRGWKSLNMSEKGWKQNSDKLQ